MSKLFISHATAEDALAKRVIRALRDRLTKFEILLDEKDLEGGDPWRNELWKWWAECDLAVVICSQAALESRWVLIEVSVLMRRRAMNPNFPILPILIDPVTPETITSAEKALFHDQELNVLQGISVSDADFDQKIDTIVARLEPLGALDRRGKPVALYEDRLAVVLEKTNNGDVLYATGNILGITADQWMGLPLQARLVARAMLEHQTRAKVIEAIQSLRARLDAADLEDLVNLVAPAWLALDEVAPLSNVVDKPAGQRGVALASSATRFAEWCVQRAAYRYPLRKPVPCKTPTTDDPVKEVVADLVAGIRKQLRLDAGADPEVYKRIIRKRDEERDPVFALVPLATPENPDEFLEPDLLDEVIRQVNARFAGIAFFVLAGRPPIAVEALTNQRVVLIAHDVEKEKSLSVDYYAALEE